jgi:hypothetical protein
VVRYDLRIPQVAKALEERSGPLDVGEEEGDRPGRQVGQGRPPWARMSRLPYLATFGGSDSPSSAGRAGPDHRNSDGRYPAF